MMLDLVFYDNDLEVSTNFGEDRQASQGQTELERDFYMLGSVGSFKCRSRSAGWYDQ